MIVFALVISFFGALISYHMLYEEVMERHQFELEHIEESVESSLKTIEKVYYFFDIDTEERMEANSHYLLKKYEQNKNFDTWDFQYLRELFNMDVFILNDNNIVIHSNFKDDIGLNFEECCPKFSKTLHERRMSGKFFTDGIDISQNTGQIKKFSYIGTPDKKYLFELGYLLQDGEVFQEFDFLSNIDQLVQKYPSINEIHVINPGGFFFGEHVADMKLPDERKEAFEKALKSREATEIVQTFEAERTVYRYVPYVSEYDKGESTNLKVIEIAYNEKELDAILSKTKRSFTFQLLAIIVVTIILASIISHWVSRPMYLAYHDSLTGLKNRAAYEEFLQEKRSEKGTLAYLILDLDNFKAVNDTYGHDVGDETLKKTASVLKGFEEKNDEIFRLGGDEFVVIIPSTTIEEAEKRAGKLIESMNDAFQKQNEESDIQLSVSIGIAFAPEHSCDFEHLYKKADQALYVSKEKGKNQYWVYREESSL